MSIKCSVFGHRFGDLEVEREREEQGSEVVITITETETCVRCGQTRVVSENKEVTTLETPSDIVGDDLHDPPEGDPDGADGRDDDRAETPEPPHEGAREEPPEAETTGEGSAHAVSGDLPIEEAPGGSTDGAGRGSVPETDAVDPEEDDGVILDEDGDAADDERAPGEWPEEDDDPEDDWVPTTDRQELRPVEEEQPDVEPTDSAVTVPEGEYYCPECGFTTDVESSSLRRGDFCPECHRGSLAHRADES